jgi:hypothetical protein
MKSIAPLMTLLLAMPALAQHDHSQHQATLESSAAPAPQRPAAREWTRLPLLAPVMSRGGERSAAALRLSGIDAAEVTVFAADGPDERRRVAYPAGPDGVKIGAAAPKVGNYHWVTARQESDTEVRVASTAWYFSNPGPAPTELLKQQKHELEIVPQPLPREHSSYREAEEWRFQVRWMGAPLADQKVMLETEFGSRSVYVTDAQGLVIALFPRDFREQQGKSAGEETMMGPRRAKFVLGTEREADGKRYVTAFNYTYSPDPDRTRSLGWGAAFGAIGMIAALPLLRRRTTTADSVETKNA